MVEMTPHGVVYDLRNSPFTVQRNGLEYKFSSVKHREKFMNEVRIREEWLADSMSRRFKMDVRFDQLADLQLYRQVETRGFIVVHLETGKVIDDSWQVQYDGMIINGENCQMRYGTTIGQLIG